MRKNIQKFLLVLGIISIGFAIASCKTHYKPLLSSKEGVNFKTITLSQAKQIAKDEHKPLFVFLHASWCPTCKRMEQEIFVQKELGETYNNDFLNVAIDYDSAEGHALNNLYPIRATPTLFFFNADGVLTEKLEGFTTADDLLAEADKLASSE